MLTAIAVLRSMDFNEYRALIAEQVRVATAQIPETKGSLELALCFTPTIGVEEVRVANAPRGSRRNVVKLKRLEVAPNLEDSG